MSLTDNNPPEGASAPLPASSDLPTAASPPTTSPDVLETVTPSDDEIMAQAMANAAAITEQQATPRIPADDVLNDATDDSLVMLMVAHDTGPANSREHAIELLIAARDGVVDTLEAVAAGAERVIEGGITEVETVAEAVEAKVQTVWDRHQQKDVAIP